MTPARLSEHFGLLRCPECGGALSLDGDRLDCSRGHAFPVIGGVPRLVAGAWGQAESALVAETSAAFGDQWVRLGENAGVAEADLSLHLPRALSLDVFRGDVLDLGCGMGRYTALVAKLGARAIGLDVSRAVDAAGRLCEDALFVQADIVAPPFAPGSFNVVYSFGVLHHLPDPLRGLRSAFGLVRPGGLLLVWVYSAHGGLLRRARVASRTVVRRNPGLLTPIAYAAAGLLHWLYLRPHRLLGRTPNHLSYQLHRGFRQLYVDCHDALAAPAEVYLSEEDAQTWLAALPDAEGGVELRSDGSGWIIWARQPA